MNKDEIIMKKRITTIFHYIVFLFCLTVGLCLLFFVLKQRYHPAKYTPAKISESAATLSNPYCGFYQLNGYVLSDSTSADIAANWGAERCSSDPYQVMLLEINLKEYSGTAISQKGLDELNAILDACTDAKKQLILRFLYDWDGQALSTEPANISIIQNHMKQISSIVNSHVDCVYLLQGIFTGNNGEMNHTNFGAPESVRVLMEQLADVIDNKIFLSVRTPAQLRSILKNKSALESSEAYSETLASRLGLYNDGLLGSVYDLGSYDDTPFSDPHDLEEKGTRAEELLFQRQLCMYVPNGGEVTVDNPYNDLPNALSDLAVMHVSYLNAQHDAAVLDKWKNSIYTGSDSLFSGKSGYDYISAHLGYRYVLTGSDLSYHAILDNAATLTLKINNRGFAPAYRFFTTTLYLTDQKTNKKTKILTTIDNRTIIGENDSVFTIDLDIRSMQSGSYNVTLEMKDSYTGLPIHFANLGYESSEEIPVGTLTVQ